MTLMERIKVKSFLSFSYSEKYNLIDSIRNKRFKSLKESKVKKIRKTKAKKAKSPRARLSAEQKALRALEKLSPEQLANIEELMGV